ncbi:Bystin-domain-containing protein [Gonapodya prolifera JEL478]|uniref:Bystin n=1 Tax=Gonapodya prolifera (strain JEL478) TaxID=1344416 RepID=A0A139AKQ6_GONPJ|nr:Bystin-domain-containing protein [Gonapodya prolifera JEL478]|eukprot:KXS17083.1 Bystin-domain-containing protein [Gonapodya prolifera JEL478]
MEQEDYSSDDDGRDAEWSDDVGGTEGGDGQRKKGAKNKETWVDAKTSEKILSLAKEQLDEIHMEERGAVSGSGAKAKKAVKDDDDDEEDDAALDFQNREEYEAYLETNLDPSDLRALHSFMPSSSSPFATGANASPAHAHAQRGQTLADVIMAKLKQRDADLQDRDARVALERPPGMNPKIVEVYSKIAHLLSRHRSGSLPKAFKIIPSFADWEEILYLTKPTEWSPMAVYQATRVFVSNLRGDMAQRFFNLVLLDHVRADISENKKLNYHLYMALKKALFKPAAFFKGILLPLLEDGTCTLKEAAIIGSVLSKVSIPVLHSAACMLKIAEMDYTGPTSVFIRILLDKKYALPYRVLDALVFHFLRFKSDARVMPVLWHQSLLVFVQRYKNDLSSDQRTSLAQLVQVKHHPQISPEVQRELDSAEERPEVGVDTEMGM